MEALTATYTDSEDEREDSVEENSKNNESSPIRSNLEESKSSKKKEVTKLVSYYHDDNDMVVSEDDGGDKESSINMSTDEGTPVEEKKVILELIKDGVQLPPEPTGKCSEELQRKISDLHKKMKTGMDMNQKIQERKDFRNPSIYEKLIQFCNIKELGTNYPPSIYDPSRFGKESYYEELAKAQKEEMDKKNKEQKEQKEKAKVEIVVGTAKKPSSSLSATVIKASGMAVTSDDKNRKSKWDQVSNQGLVGSIIPTAAPLTTAATGTKGTVISAFGSLPKKPKVGS